MEQHFLEETLRIVCMAYVKEAAKLSMIRLQREDYSAIKDKIMSFEGKIMGTIDHHVKGNKLSPEIQLSSGQTT